MWRPCGIVAACLCLSVASFAAELSVHLANEDGVPLADAVVFIPGLPVSPAPGTRRRVTILQRNRLFVPFVTVVEKGTAISFPNEDPLLHHVYSFSPAKRFEIKLYKGTPSTPVVFDKAGVVAVGCNVHDWMLAYVVVVETSFFAKSGADGKLQLSGLPAGEHQLMVWYPGMRDPIPLQRVTLTAPESRTIEQQLRVNIKTQPKAMPLDPLRYSLLTGISRPPEAELCTSRD
jgi:plastocyanin